ncbi:TetR/AcrR family transcriptional regulator [Halodesulfovibrio sp.]|jgi:AcrR family transcriptional regulator|uniref:TetR/AcrR family transcriptional regulator n=1 Tax=Halodesulfovibrio sp. TaxID=1912772 RepID=UPI0025FA10D0|nr:TetR/AcrR family transcriptional regulator [Halodesulfovibrio sp.]MCT4535433.1 TetR/AcrR family transcriptional regulator [Halodesulfovibrio sp.]MCT4626246.1 TetR/AcrR family transcriptional regulator [Halodesulfovibrio sp.]
MGKVVGPERFRDIAVKYFQLRDSSLQAWQEHRAQVQSAPDTRSRIFNTARTVFAQHGQSATVREICRAANANVSAVNYHFGNKDRLQASVLEDFLYEIRGIYPLHGGVDDSAEPEERLFGFTLACISGMLISHGDEYWNLNRLLHDAFINRFEAFQNVAHENNMLLRGIVTPIVDTLTGHKCNEQQLDALLSGYFSQLFFYVMHIDDLLLAKEQKFFTDSDAYGIAQHITAFSIGGIKNYSELMDAEIDFPSLWCTACCESTRYPDGVQ